MRWMYEHERIWYAGTVFVVLGMLFFFSTASNTLTGLVVSEIDKELNVSQAEAFAALLEAQANIKTLQQSNFSTYYVESEKAFIGDPLRFTLESETPYAQELKEKAKALPEHEAVEKDFEKVLSNTQKIIERRKQAFAIQDLIAVMQERERRYNTDGADTTKGRELLGLAKIAFFEERFDEAEAYLDTSQLRLEEAYVAFKQKEEIVRLRKGFWQTYGLALLLLLIVLVGGLFPTMKILRKKYAHYKIKQLTQELKTLEEQLRIAQEQCFMKQKIPKRMYDVKAQYYKKRMAAINRQLPVLRGIIERKKQEKPQGQGILRIQAVLKKEKDRHKKNKHL
jgi:hypothetical protein